MLGNSISNQLAINSNFEVIRANRQYALDSFLFDARRDNVERLISRIKPDYVINSIMAKKTEAGSKLANNFYLHTKFQKSLMEACVKNKSFLIQPATDAVFKSSTGANTEISYKDGKSIYSRTKILGERYANNTLFLRTSLLGIDLKEGYDPHLFSWLLSRPSHSSVNGFTNYLWNGISTNTFAQIVEQIMLVNFKEPRTQHIVPANWLSKFQILKYITKSANRLDLKIVPTELKRPIDLRLSTEFPDFNAFLFNLAGYSQVPTIEKMIDLIV